MMTDNNKFEEIVDTKNLSVHFYSILLYILYSIS